MELTKILRQETLEESWACVWLVNAIVVLEGRMSWVWWCMTVSLVIVQAEEGL
jgi:hypothetical protein